LVQGGVQSAIDIEFFIKAVIGASLFMLLFLTANVMMQSVRERIPEFAVLKTIGFTDGGIFALVLCEAVTECVLGAVIGLGIALTTVFLISRISVLKLSAGFLPQVTPLVFLSGTGLAIAVALISALQPAWRAKRLSVVNALANR